VSNRPITFSKLGTLGEWVNHETGVVIQKQTDGSYRPFRPADVTTGYIGISRAKRTLAEAKHEAAQYIDGSIRHWMGVAYAEAVAEHVARAADAAEAAGAPTWRAAAARRMIGYAIEGHVGWLASAINEVRRLEEWTAEYARMAHEQAIDGDHAEAPAYESRLAVIRELDEAHAEALTMNDTITVVRRLDALVNEPTPIRVDDRVEIGDGRTTAWSGTWRVTEIHGDIRPWATVTDGYVQNGAPVALMTRVSESPAPTVPADVDDDKAWTEYCAALPDPTDAELAAVIADHANPFAEQIASCDEGFRASARMIWRRNRAAGRFDPLDHRYLREAMKTYAETGRTFRALGEAAAYATLSQMHLAASVEGADAMSVTFDGTVA
jgi:hypothetical protein